MTESSRIRVGGSALYPAAKRTLDVVASAAGLIILSPVIAAVMAVLLISSGRPVIFCQVRPGMEGRPFRAYKFRTMRPASEDAEPQPDAARLTAFGKFLRSTSIDELPGLLNVLRGDMSLVGPRPLLMEYLPLYDARQVQRHLVKPGLTGWAQVNGRNTISWERRFELDLWYIENRSIALDLRILLLTLKKVVAREGITQEGHATMERFRGSGRL